MQKDYFTVRSVWWVSLFLLAVLAMLVWSGVWQLGPDFRLRITSYSLGSRDQAVIVKTMSGASVLIDGEADRAVLEALGAELPFWQRSIDLLVLTDPRADRIQGLREVLKRYRVAQVLLTETVARAAAYQPLQRLLQERRVRIQIARVGQKVHVDDATVVHILYPPAGSIASSLAGRLSFGATDVLLLRGEAEQQEYLLPALQGGTADVLLLLGQGAKLSLDQQLIRSVQPRSVLIPCGKTSRNGKSPASPAVQALENEHIRYACTDAETIRIVSDGKEIEMKKL